MALLSMLLESFLTVFLCALQLMHQHICGAFLQNISRRWPPLTLHHYHPDPKPLGSRTPKGPPCFCSYPLPPQHILYQASKRCANTYEADGAPLLLSSLGVFIFCALFGLLTVARRLSMTQILPLLQPFSQLPFVPCPRHSHPHRACHPPGHWSRRASIAQDTAWLIHSGLLSGCLHMHLLGEVPRPLYLQQHMCSSSFSILSSCWHCLHYRRCLLIVSCPHLKIKSMGRGALDILFFPIAS